MPTGNTQIETSETPAPAGVFFDQEAVNAAQLVGAYAARAELDRLLPISDHEALGRYNQQLTRFVMRLANDDEKAFVVRIEGLKHRAAVLYDRR